MEGTLEYATGRAAQNACATRPLVSTGVGDFHVAMEAEAKRATQYVDLARLKRPVVSGDRIAGCETVLRRPSPRLGSDFGRSSA
jgi:hypothetical protein